MLQLYKEKFSKKEGDSYPLRFLLVGTSTFGAFISLIHSGVANETDSTITIAVIIVNFTIVFCI